MLIFVKSLLQLKKNYGRIGMLMCMFYCFSIHLLRDGNYRFSRIFSKSVEILSIGPVGKIPPRYSSCEACSGIVSQSIVLQAIVV